MSEFPEPPRHDENHNPAAEAAPQRDREKDIAQLEARLQALDREIASTKADIEKISVLFQTMPVTLEEQATQGAQNIDENWVPNIHGLVDKHTDEIVAAIRATRSRLQMKLMFRAADQQELILLRQRQGQQMVDQGGGI